MKLYEICVSSDLANLASVSEFVAERARLVGLKEDQVFDLQMATDEACTNSIEHAYKGQRDGEVRVCCFLENTDFVVRITDFGAPFDPSTIPEPDTSAPLEERNIGGLGLFFMRKLVDEIEFSSSPHVGNQVTMRKRRRQ